MSNALSHVLDGSREVPGSAHGALLPLDARSHFNLSLLGPLGLLNGNARASIGTEDFRRLVEESIVGSSGTVLLFFEVFSHVERHGFVVSIAELIDGTIIQRCDTPDGDGDNKNKDNEDEGQAAVTSGAAALSAENDTESSTSVESEAHSDKDEGSLKGCVHLLHSFLSFREVESGISNHLLKPVLRAIAKASRGDQYTDSTD